MRSSSIHTWRLINLSCRSRSPYLVPSKHHFSFLFSFFPFFPKELPKNRALILSQKTQDPNAWPLQTGYQTETSFDHIIPQLCPTVLLYYSAFACHQHQLLMLDNDCYIDTPRKSIQNGRKEKPKTHHPALCQFQA